MFQGLNLQATIKIPYDFELTGQPYLKHFAQVRLSSGFFYVLGAFVCSVELLVRQLLPSVCFHVSARLPLD
jgi:hypothetical protein